MFKTLGMKMCYFVAYGISLAGMIALLIYPGNSQFWLSLFIIGGKFGIAANFTTCYVGNQYLFPVQAVVFAFSACNLFSRSATILSPAVAEIKPESVAKWTFIAAVSIALVTINFLRDK